MKNNKQVKLIAASIAIAASFQAYAGLGGLDIKSNLDEPFSGNITATGEEAKALLNGGNVTVSGKGMTAKIRKLGEKAVITVSSSQAVHDPVLVFRVGAGSQVREYTALLDPAGYSPKSKPTFADVNTANSKTVPETKLKENQNTITIHKTNKKDEANTAGKTNVQHAKPVRNSKTHTVRKGETIKGIAAAIRPKHLTIEQVIDALLKANPDISRHGKLRAGSMLQIPNLNKIKAAAPKKVRKEYSKPQTEKSKTETMPSEIYQPAPTEKPLEKQTTVPTEEKTDKPVVQPAATEAPASAAVERKPLPPENTAIPEAASAVTAESASGETAASAINALADETDHAVSEPIAEPASEVTAEPVEQTSAEGETTDGLLSELFDDSYTMQLAGGGAALIILLLLLRLAQSKRARRMEEPVFEKEAEFSLDDAADDGIEITFTETESTPIQETGGNIPLALSEESEEELSKTQTFNLESDTPSNHIDLDFDNLETAQNGILSSALTQDEETQKREHADWNDIESTDSVYEPESVNPYNPVEIIINTPQPQPAEQESVQAEIDTDFYNNLFPSHDSEIETTAAEPSSGSQPPSGLAGFLKASSPEIILKKTVAEVQTPEELHDFLKVYETEPVGETVERTTSKTPDFNTTADDLSALLQPFATPSVEDATTENVSETPNFNAIADDLSALLQPFETPSVKDAATENVSETTDFNATADDLSALLQPFATPSVEGAATENVSETPNFNATADDLAALLQPFETPSVEDAATENVSETPNFNATADDLAALLQPFETPSVEDAATENVSEVSDFNNPAENDLQDFLKDSETETVDWKISLPEETIPDSSYSTVITSESIGSDAPLEAKYDLAKMYLEIDDRDAAAETVKELLEEAEGDILKRAQALAQELGIM